NGQPAASTGTFAISGVVLDSSEAAIPGANVTLRGVGRDETATTDQTGAFRFPGRSPGVYEVQAAAAGFKSAKTRLSVGPRSVPAVRMILSINEAHEEVTVSTRADQVNTDVAGNLDVIILDRTMLDSLPIQGNDVL